MNFELETYCDPSLYRLAVDGFARANLAECNHLFSTIQGMTPEIVERRQSWLARVHRNGITRGIALINSLQPARVVSMSGLDTEATRLIADALHSDNLMPTAIIGPQHAIDALAVHLTQQLSVSAGSRMRLGNHMLTTEPLAPACGGQWRVATEDDSDLLMRWELAFVVECKLPDGSQNLHREISERIASPTALYWLWEVEGLPVATALGRCMPPVGRVGMVYTDSEQRKRGYAGALVAHLSRQLIVQGCEAVFLFTDMANPISNGVYQRIGFRLLGELVQVELTSTLKVVSS